ncbi:MAG TPA: ABC transporter permease [Vicinamibacterales bacterium]|nr:ABC transporter permease [Vicinamibacterales bacterium]
MSALSRLRHLWRNVVHRDRVDRDLDDELHTTLALLEQEHRQSGLAPDAARRAAAIQLGRVGALKEQVFDVKAGAFVAAFVLDVRHAVRLLRRGPLFALFAIASLALGIGATAAIFTLFDAIALQKLPVPEPDRLVVASFGTPSIATPGRPYNYSMPTPQFVAIRERTTTLDGIFATSPFGRVTISGRDGAEAAYGVFVSGDYYRTLRLTPAAGRLIDARDDRPGQQVAVLNHGYWQRRFGGRPDVIGAAIALNGVPFTIVGVEPRGFTGTEVGRPHDVSVPLQAYPALNEGRPMFSGPFTTWLYIMARLKPGVTIAAAEEEAQRIFTQAGLDAARNADDRRMARESRLRFEPGSLGNASDLRIRYERWLRLLLMLLAAVLLLASLNVATLLLSRSDARRHEIATRLALGAARRRIVRQFVTESLVLAGLAGAAGLLLASWGSRLLLSVAFPSVEAPPIPLTANARLFGFTAAVSLVTCLLCGLIPALRATAAPRLAPDRQIGARRRRRMLDRALVASQVGVSLVLLVAAGHFLRTLQNLWQQDTGYDRRQVLMFSADARLAGKTGDAIPETYRRILEELRPLPNVVSVTMSAVRPVSENYYFITSFRHAGGRTLSNEQRIRAAFNHVAPGYFATLGIPVVAGRDFDERDTRESPRVAIVSERMARHFVGSPIGQQIDTGAAARQIVGVVRDVRYANVKDPIRDVIYFPALQIKDIFYSPTFEIRHAGPAAELLARVREAMSRIDPGLTIFKATTLEQQTADSFARERLLALLASYVGAFATLLACIGLYGLVSYGVTRRTAEMGLRMALGAPPAAVRWMVVREDASTILAGAAAGVGAAAAAMRLVRSQLYGVDPFDPAIVTAATGTLLVMAFAAAYLPARRAARIPAMEALRHE